MTSKFKIAEKQQPMIEISSYAAAVHLLWSRQRRVEKKDPGFKFPSRQRRRGSLTDRVQLVQTAQADAAHELTQENLTKLPVRTRWEHLGNWSSGYRV